MIITKLYGGLGNQMFQYAAGRALSLRLRQSLYMDTSWFDDIRNSEDVTQRNYELDIFNILPIPLSLMDRLSLKMFPATLFQEKDYRYHKEFNYLSGNILLDGYWQSYKYFKDYRDEILSAFKFPERISPQNKQILSVINNSNSVSVHIRRGDYATKKTTNNFHGLVPLDFYHSAINKFKDKKPNYFIFSDDPAWCKKHLDLSSNTNFIEHNKGDQSYEDMRLMSNCKHNIIANSSFSWWAGWLNQNPDKRIYAPANWFQAEDAGMDDRIPKEWIIL